MGKPRDGGLTDKQKLFAREYLKDLNATQAAIRAGYSAHTAKVTGSKLRDDPGVLKFIDDMQAERADRLDISIDRIEQELARVAFFDITKLLGDDNRPLSAREMPVNERAAIASLDVVEVGGADTPVVITKMKAADKIRALELLGKRHGMFVDKVEMKVEDLTDEQLAAKANSLIAKGLERKKAEG